MLAVDAERIAKSEENVGTEAGTLATFEFGNETLVHADFLGKFRLRQAGEFTKTANLGIERHRNLSINIPIRLGEPYTANVLYTNVTERQLEGSEMKRRDKCKHYTGTVNPTCDAGVNYADVEQGKGTPQYSLPCIGRYNPLGVTCEKCELPSAEELAADEAEMKARMESMGKARKAIVEHLGGPWKKGMNGSAGKINCPVCGVADALRFTRSGYNGHIHAKCVTGCVAWME